MKPVRFVCPDCGDDFPPHQEACSRCGRPRPSPRLPVVGLSRERNGYGLAAAWMTLAAGSAVTALGIISRFVWKEPFSHTVVLLVIGIIYVNIAVGSFLRRRAAFFAGAVAGTFPALLFLARSLEMFWFLSSSGGNRRWVMETGLIFMGFFVFFAVLVMVHFLAWLERGRRIS